MNLLAQATIFLPLVFGSGAPVDPPACQPSPPLVERHIFHEDGGLSAWMEDGTVLTTCAFPDMGCTPELGHVLYQVSEEQPELLDYIEEQSPLLHDELMKFYPEF